jgi:hypothetical protein
MSTPHILLEDTYATYPHCNGYYDGGNRVALGRADGTEEIVGVRWEGAGDPEVLLPAEFIASESGHRQEPWSVESPQRSVLWFDIALDAQTLVCARGGALFHVELAAERRAPRVAYRSTDGWTLDGLTSVTSDGRTAVISESREGEHRALLLDLAEGTTTEIVRHPWHANHFHFAPADESWIGYSHEGLSTSVEDRLWAWHPLHAPEGRSIVDQRELADAPGAAVALGHERWMFHDVGAVVIVYGESPAGLRGVYETFVDGRAARLISAGERDWHCGISRDGRRIIVDTTGPEDAPGRGWADAGNASSLVLVDAVTGARRVLADTGFIAHPYHPHPSFTPDGTAIVFNHVEFDAAGTVRLRGAAMLPLG